MVKKAVASADSGLGISFLFSKKADILHSGFAVPHDWADASAFPKEVFPQLKAPSTFPTETLSELFSFIQSNFSD